MNNIKKYKEKLIGIFSDKNSKTLFFIILLGSVGMLLISLSDFFPSEHSLDDSTADKHQQTIDYEQEELLESRIEAEISKISGAGETSVLLTFDSSEEYFYAKNSTEEEDSEEKNTEHEFVVIEGESGEKPVVIKTKKAKIRGVLVICEGGDDPTVREKIIEALCALLDIPSNCVSVAKMA